MPRRIAPPGVASLSVNFHASVPLSAFSATTFPPPTKYMMLLMTIGAEPALAYVHAWVRLATLAGVIWFAGEYFMPPTSPATAGQSVVAGLCAPIHRLAEAAPAAAPRRTTKA